MPRHLFIVLIFLSLCHLAFSQGISRTDEELFSFSQSFLNQISSFYVTHDDDDLISVMKNLDGSIERYSKKPRFRMISTVNLSYRQIFERVQMSCRFLDEHAPELSYEEKCDYLKDITNSLFMLSEYQTVFFSHTLRRYVAMIAAALFAFFIASILILRLRRRQRLDRTEIALRRKYADSVLKAQEKERQNISNELHDTVAQQIRALRLESERLVSSLPAAQDSCDFISKTASDCIEEIRSICYNLTPPDLKLESSPRRLEILLSFLCGDSKIPCAFSFDKEIPAIDSETVLLNLFRIVQEALQNAAKHSGAKNVSVNARLLPTKKDKQNLVIFVTDDGRGFSVSQKTVEERGLHFGLQSMFSRAEVIGAKVEITSSEEEGTVVKIIEPLPPPPVIGIVKFGEIEDIKEYGD